MALKPANSGNGGEREYEVRNYPVPKAGLRRARVSMIVDMGIQKREDFEDTKTGETKPQKPCHQLAVFADLVNDEVDYGGSIGTQQYRLLLNKAYKGVIQGINFVTGPAKDADGNVMRDKPWGLHPQNVLTKLCKAIGKPELAFEKKGQGLDIEPILGEAFMADVEVKITDHKDGKKDKDGNVIQYKNVNFKGSAQVPSDDDDNPITIKALKATPRCITFDGATKEDIQFIRGNLLKQIKLAENYAGSQMQKAVEAWEADQSKDDDDDQKEEQKEAPKKPDPKKGKDKKEKAPVEDMDDDVPF